MYRERYIYIYEHRERYGERYIEREIYICCIIV